MDFNTQCKCVNEQTPNYRFCTKSQEKTCMGQLFLCSSIHYLEQMVDLAS